MAPTPSTLLDGSRSRAGGPRALQLLVIGNGVVGSYPLPAGSKLVVGRGEDADIHLPDTKASRRHVRFHVDERGEVDIEELGSANGTYVLDRRLGPAEKLKVNAGEAIRIGALLLMVDFDRPAGARPALARAELEARIEWERARAEAMAGVFSVACVLADAGTAAAALRSIDVVGHYAPRQQAILLPGLTRDAAAVLVRAFAGSDAVRTGVASYPADGSTSAALLARAAARARGEERAIGGFPDGGMRHVEALAARAAGTDIPVLILGESGSGKEVLAAHHPRLVEARGSTVRRHQLRRAFRVAAGERAVRARAWRVHRRDAPSSRACSRARRAARSSSTRSASCRCRSKRSCCA